MAKGDKIDVIYKIGDTAAAGSITASKDGRTVEADITTENKITWLIVTEKTRGGTTVRIQRYLLSEVIMYSETPYEKPAPPKRGK